MSTHGLSFNRDWIDSSHLHIAYQDRYCHRTEYVVVFSFCHDFWVSKTSCLYCWPSMILFIFMGVFICYCSCFCFYDLCPQVSSTNKTDRHDIAEIFLKVALNTLTQTLKKSFVHYIIIFLCVIR
jgi:hypothetical protein